MGNRVESTVLDKLFAEAADLLEVAQVEGRERLPIRPRAGDEERVRLVRARWRFVGLAEACEDRDHGPVPRA